MDSFLGPVYYFLLPILLHVLSNCCQLSLQAADHISPDNFISQQLFPHDGSDVILSRQRRKMGKIPQTNVEPEIYAMMDNYVKCCKSAIVNPSWSKKQSCYDQCPKAMAEDSVKSTCKSQDGIAYCLDSLKTAHKSCTKNKYPHDRAECKDACQDFLDGLVDRTYEQLNKTLKRIRRCLGPTGNELSELLEDLQYHKGTHYESCCDEIESRDYQSWTCSREQCRRHLQTLDVRISYENLREKCVDPSRTATSFSLSDAEEAVLHLKKCLKVSELNKFPRDSKVPRDDSLNLTWTLSTVNGQGMYCCNMISPTDSCHRHCTNIFTMRGGSKGTSNNAESFDLACGQRSDIGDAVSCVQNIVAGQCRPGCSRMNFCSSFNNQPESTFRRCTDEADQAASSLYKIWSRNNKIMFAHLEEEEGSSGKSDKNKGGFDSDGAGMGVEIALKDISNCEPLVFKAAACALTIKPCSRTHTSKLCRSDCIRLLSKCGNFSKAGNAVQSCDMLLGVGMFGSSSRKYGTSTGNSLEDETDCVSIYGLSETQGSQSSSYGSSSSLSTSSSSSGSASSEVSYPCSSSNLCRDSQLEVCELTRPSLHSVPSTHARTGSGSRYSSGPGTSTVQSKCTKGCAMQDWEMIHMKALPGDIVISTRDGLANACVACRCVQHIDPSKTSFYCDLFPRQLLKANCSFELRKFCPKSTKADNPNVIRIGQDSSSERSYRSSSGDPPTDYMAECNLCSCLDGKAFCTKRLCLSDYVLENDDTTKMNKYGLEFTGMPDNADDEYLATCALNGRTYPNDQVAEALGISPGSYQLGMCELRKRCWMSSCPFGYKCVTNREVCLSKTHECIQHRCVKEDDCLQHVCDEDGRTHASRCDTDLPITTNGRRAEIAYPGRCDQKCEMKKVCGTNGHTYSSACAAHQDRVLVDYPGKCRDFAIQLSDKEPRECYKIENTCSALPSFCRGVHAFGVCCPICGAVARLIVVPDLVDMVHLTLVGNVSHNPADQYTVRDVVLAVRQQITLPQCDVYGHLSLDDSVTLLFTVPVQSPSPTQVQACILESKRIISLVANRDITLISNIHLFPIVGADLEHSFVKFTAFATPAIPTPNHTLISLLLLTLFTWRYYLFTNSFSLSSCALMTSQVMTSSSIRAGTIAR
ncbi:reversion-inducing cysteine-rich protein with Kazal motifs-like isoform X2 [Convolutriloba macropyga]|uniref:reversion-inducing cysteine-rich protein with Kazal motifs-like isoform X2 n=1 Tax=Convolutriloba macropyga TaxID=536237 RepID=UPI003F51C88A